MILHMRKPRSDRLRRLTAHWPGMSEQERLTLVLALLVNGLLTMGLELLVSVALWRGARRGWQTRQDGMLSVGRATAGAALPLAAVSALQKVVARVAFTFYERRLRERSASTR